MNNEYAKLKEEFEEWKSGKRGVEEYYEMKYQRDQFKSMLLKLREAFYVQNSSKAVKAAFVSIADEFNELKGGCTHE